MKALRAVALAAALVPLAALAALDPVEERIAAAVKQRTPAALELLERAVRINSGTLNVEGVREVGRVFRAELDALGFTTDWIEMPPQMHRAGHLVATRGKAGKRALLLGHIDTVFDRESSVPIWDRRDGIVRGQGVNDMKGGVVVMIEALRALQREGLLDTLVVTVVLTGDEERVGQPIEIARAPVTDAARRSDVALSFEAVFAARGGDESTAGRRGSAEWRLSVDARPGHSRNVGSAEAGFGAINEAARIVNALRETVREEGLTLNPGLIVGGSSARYDAKTASGQAEGKPNIIAARAEVDGDLRYVDAAQRDRAVQLMRDVAAGSLPGTQATLHFAEGYPPMPETPGNRALLEAYSRTSVDAGFGPIRGRASATGGAGDIQFAAPYADCLDGIGTRGQGSHSDQEQMELASVERAAIRAAVFLYRLSR